MDIPEFGGEFALIDEITRKGGAIVGVGDDAAVIKYSKEMHLLVTTDMLCEGDHFRRARHFQIKAGGDAFPQAPDIAVLDVTSVFA